MAHGSLTPSTDKLVGVQAASHRDSGQMDLYPYVEVRIFCYETNIAHLVSAS